MIDPDKTYIFRGGIEGHRYKNKKCKLSWFLTTDLKYCIVEFLDIPKEEQIGPITDICNINSLEEVNEFND